MYIDDGGADAEIKVEVDGQEYIADETVDYNHDGVLDGARTATPSGGELLYVDTDHDGLADTAVEYDQSHHVVGEAGFDAHSGDWVGETLGTDAVADPVNGAAEHIHVDNGHGGIDAGAATVDSDGDGRNDTVIVQRGDETVLYTDTNHDGSADVATVISPDGHTETVEHIGPGEWATVGGDAVRDPAGDEVWGAPVGSVLGAGVVRIDPSTGQWISQN